jgi:hypothetical protein
MGLKDFFIKKTLEHKLKNVPKGERDRLMAVMEKNPDFFKQIGDKVQAKVKGGMSEMAATMMVMREHQAELQKLMSE